MTDSDDIGVMLAKHAYVEGSIDLETLETALDDRLTGSSYAHDERIDGHIPASMKGDITPIHD